VWKINRPTWIAVWTIAILLAVVGGIFPQTESWRFDIQLPGIDLALVLMAVFGPYASMFGADGLVFQVAVTILKNGVVYAALITLVLVVRGVFKKQS
jgi:hypothetical protein